MNPPPPSWVPFVAATATLIAALVALFKEDVAKLWRRPNLRLRITLGAPDCVLMQVVVRYEYLAVPNVYANRAAVTSGVGGDRELREWHGSCYFL